MKTFEGVSSDLLGVAAAAQLAYNSLKAERDQEFEEDSATGEAPKMEVLWVTADVVEPIRAASAGDLDQIQDCIDALQAGIQKVTAKSPSLAQVNDELGEWQGVAAEAASAYITGLQEYCEELYTVLCQLNGVLIQFRDILVSAREGIAGIVDAFKEAVRTYVDGDDPAIAVIANILLDVFVGTVKRSIKVASEIINDAVGSFLDEFAGQAKSEVQIKGGEAIDILVSYFDACDQLKEAAEASTTEVNMALNKIINSIPTPPKPVSLEVGPDFDYRTFEFDAVNGTPANVLQNLSKVLDELVLSTDGSSSSSSAGGAVPI